MTEEKQEKSLTTGELALQLGCYYVDRRYDDAIQVLTTGLLDDFTFTGDLGRCVPILRLLNDISEKEAKELLLLSKQKEVVIVGNLFNAFQYKWLLAQHIDLFGWIEKGLAIDATTLDANPYEIR